MKKSLLLLPVLVLGALSTSAQITITSADVATPTKQIYQADDALPTVNEGTAGISQTWNMTALNTSSIDTLTFISYSWVPNPSFTTSNLIANGIVGTDTNYVYLINNSTGLSTLGTVGHTDFGGGRSTVKQINTPAEILMSFPGNYLTTYNNNYNSVTQPFYFGVDPGIGVPIDSVRQNSEVKKTVLVDAWGSLTTPLGTFNVLRSKETVVRYDTSDVYIAAFGGWNNAIVTAADSTTGYSWWANGVGFPLVSMKLDSSSAVSQLQWLKALPAVGVEEYSNATEAKVFPNPAQDVVNFAVDAAVVSAIQMYDITGRMVDYIPVGAMNVSVNTSGYAAGTYTYALVSKSNVILNRGKFSVAK